MLKNRSVVIIGIITLIAVIGLILLTLVLVPESNEPYQVAVDFINAAGLGNDVAAYPLLSAALQAYVDENCPDGRVSGCILAYTPSEWGTLIKDGSAVYRRSVRDGAAWDVQIVATYQEGQGFSGVCIYNRVEEVEPDEWRVTAWSGFVSCDAPDSGLQGLRRADAPNRAP